MRLRHVLALALTSGVATGCASHLRREVVGHGAATVTLRGQEAPSGNDGQAVAAPAGGIALARGRYEMALHFDVPHAQVVEYVVTCPNVTIPGRVGEPFEAYRTRRLAELRAKAERDRRNAAAVTGAIVGSVAPDVRASGQATGPNGTATVDANVSGQAVGAVAGQAVAQSMPIVAELPPGDVGAGRLNARVDLETPMDVTCSVNAIAEDVNVVATYDLTRVRDLDAEARERQIAATAGARAVRGQLTAQLTVVGADPEGLRKRREAEAHARAQAAAEAEQRRAEAEAKRAELRAEAEAERRRRQAIADGERAQREAAEADARAKRQAIADAERAKRQAADADARAKRQAQIEAERARADAERIRLNARLEAEAQLEISIELRRKEAALGARGQLIAYLAGECHADPNKRERERAQLAVLEEQRQLKLKLELDARMKLEAQVRADRDARDAKLRAEREAREATLRAEREARDAKLRVELDARLKIEAQVRAEREARDAKLRAEREAKAAFEADQRRAREAKAQAERDARIALELEARRVREAEKMRRLELALSIRAELQASLVRIGARERPPMPALLAENQGSAPFDGAAWIAGYWQWAGGEWSWVKGGWRDTTTFGASGSVGGAIVTVNAAAANVVIDTRPTVDGSISVQADVPATTNVRDHRTSGTSDGPVVRDHRTTSAPTVRDHRKDNDTPVVRDHRNKDEDKKTEAKPVVRDHRTH